MIEVWPTQREEDDFEKTLSYYDDVKQMGMYPAKTLTEDGVHLIEPENVTEEMYPYRGLKVVVKKGLFVW